MRICEKGKEGRSGQWVGSMCSVVGRNCIVLGVFIVGVTDRSSLTLLFIRAICTTFPIPWGLNPSPLSHAKWSKIPGCLLSSLSFFFFSTPTQDLRVSLQQNKVLTPGFFSDHPAFSPFPVIHFDESLMILRGLQMSRWWWVSGWLMQVHQKGRMCWMWEYFALNCALLSYYWTYIFFLLYLFLIVVPPLLFSHLGAFLSFEQLMGLEKCHENDEECLKRRMVAEAHLDYIYTQHHKP